MLKKRYESSDELIDSIIKRPLEAFFSIRMDGKLLDRINENADDMKDSISEIVNETIALGLCILQCFMHIGELVFFPVVKAVRFVKFRKDVIKREKQYRDDLKRRFVPDEGTR